MYFSQSGFVNPWQPASFCFDGNSGWSSALGMVISAMQIQAVGGITLVTNDGNDVYAFQAVTAQIRVNMNIFEKSTVF